MLQGSIRSVHHPIVATKPLLKAIFNGNEAEGSWITHWSAMLTPSREIARGTVRRPVVYSPAALVLPCRGIARLLQSKHPGAPRGPKSMQGGKGSPSGLPS